MIFRFALFVAVPNGGDRRLPLSRAGTSLTGGNIVDRSDEADCTGVKLSLYCRALLANLLHRLRHIGLGDFRDVRVVFRSFQGRMPTQRAGSSRGAQ